MFISSYESIKGNDMYQFLQALSRGPLIVPIYATNLMYYFSGIIDNEGVVVCPETQIPNHAVLAVGYNIDLANPGNSFIKFKNSWGSDWGEGGFFRILLSDLRITNGLCNIL